MSELSNTGLGLNQETINMYAIPRAEGEINMVDHVYIVLKDMISESAANKFFNSLDIVTIYDLSTTVQRHFINRYFIRLLLSSRFTHNVNVLMPINYLVYDGYVEDWFTLFKTYIVPFIKESKLLD